MPQANYAQCTSALFPQQVRSTAYSRLDRSLGESSVCIGVSKLGPFEKILFGTFLFGFDHLFVLSFLDIMRCRLLKMPFTLTDQHMDTAGVETGEGTVPIGVLKSMKNHTIPHETGHR